MNYTEEQRREIYNKYGFVNIPVDIERKIVQDRDELEKELAELKKELAASRENRILSAVPSELEQDIQAILHGCSSLDYPLSQKIGSIIFRQLIENYSFSKRGISG